MEGPFFQVCEMRSETISRSNISSANTVCNRGPSWTTPPGPLGSALASSQSETYLLLSDNKDPQLVEENYFGKRKLNKDVIMSSTSLKIAIKMGEINF